jgi:hypothetical protein
VVNIDGMVRGADDGGGTLQRLGRRGALRSQTDAYGPWDLSIRVVHSACISMKGLTATTALGGLPQSSLEEIPCATS